MTLPVRRTADGSKLAKTLSERASNDVRLHFSLGIVLAAEKQYGLAVHTFASRSLYPYLGDPAWHRRQLASALRLAAPV